MDKLMIATLSLVIMIAIGILQTNSIRRAILLSGVLSIVSSFVYILLLAPDVALAEAVIGCTLSTIILMMASQYLDVINIVYTIQNISDKELALIFTNEYDKEKFDVHFSSNQEDPRLNLFRYHHLDYYIVEKNQRVILYCSREDHHLQTILNRLQVISDKPVQLIRESESYEK